MNKLLHKNITDKILKAYFSVYNSLGYGFLERVYQNAMYFELKELGVNVEAQKQIKVYYKNQLVGEYFADLIIEDLIIVELKASELLMTAHRSQLYNYLKSTKMEVGLLLNFGSEAEFERIIFTNDKKVNLNE
uniref:GxxExxY protein n=1 Tax=Flavobacterium sp. TaxID=239 RepID=UPI0040494C03